VCAKKPAQKAKGEVWRQMKFEKAGKCRSAATPKAKLRLMLEVNFAKFSLANMKFGVVYHAVMPL
jgi:hypothetical protein